MVSLQHILLHLLRLALHMLWLPPLYYQRYYFFCAAVLFIAIFYIKSFKLAKQIEVLPAEDATRVELLQLTRTLRLWRSLTYLR